MAAWPGSADAVIESPESPLLLELQLRPTYWVSKKRRNYTGVIFNGIQKPFLSRGNGPAENDAHSTQPTSRINCTYTLTHAGEPGWPRAFSTDALAQPHYRFFSLCRYAISC